MILDPRFCRVCGKSIDDRCGMAVLCLSCYWKNRSSGSRFEKAMLRIKELEAKVKEAKK